MDVCGGVPRVTSAKRLANWNGSAWNSQEEMLHAAASDLVYCFNRTMTDDSLNHHNSDNLYRPAFEANIKRSWRPQQAAAGRSFDNRHEA